jgi:hypothetical protein
MTLKLRPYDVSDDDGSQRCDELMVVTGGHKVVESLLFRRVEVVDDKQGDNDFDKSSGTSGAVAATLGDHESAADG